MSRNYWRIHSLETGQLEAVELRPQDEVFYATWRLSRQQFAIREEAEDTIRYLQADTERGIPVMAYARGRDTQKGEAA